MDEDGEYYFLFQVILTFCSELTSRYFFRTLTEYYVFRLMRFLSANPKITRCECCSKYFVPKNQQGGPILRPCS